MKITETTPKVERRYTLDVSAKELAGIRIALGRCPGMYTEGFLSLDEAKAIYGAIADAQR